MLYRFIFKILKELAETQQDLEITRSSNMTILTLLLEKKICSKEEYVSTFNEIQSKNMENINQIKNKIHEIEEQIKQYEQQMRKKLMDSGDYDDAQLDTTIQLLSEKNLINDKIIKCIKCIKSIVVV